MKKIILCARTKYLGRRQEFLCIPVVPLETGPYHI